MRLKALIYASLVLCGLLSSWKAFSQLPQQNGIPFRKPGSDSMKVVQILNAKTYHMQTIDSVTQLTTLVGDVRIKQERTLIDCDSMILNPSQNYLESFGHVHINDEDSTNIYSDYMKYEVDKRIVHFQRSVKLTDGKGILTTEELQYDLNEKVGTYEHGGKIVNKGSVLTSERGIYYEETKDVIFKNNVVLRDPQYDMATDSLLYNTSTQVSTFITKTFIQFKDSTRRTVTTSSGYYDLLHHKAEFGLRPVITDGSQRITGDSLRLDDSTGISVAVGNAIYRDTAEGMVLTAGRMYNNKKNNYFLATEKPVMVIKQDKDSLYIAADTLFSARLIDRPILTKKVAAMDSLHRKFVDSLYKESSDSLRRMSADSVNGRDTLRTSSPDSTHPMVMKIRGDSVVRAVLLVDSTGKVVDSVSRRPDTLLVTQGKRVVDSLLSKRPPPRFKPKPGVKPGGIAPAGGLAPPGGAGDSSRSKAPMQAKAPEIDRDHEKFVDTAKSPITDSTLRYIQAYHHVRIYSDSLQAVADSLYYSGQDSVFRLFYNPIAWGNGNYQITGDTMYVYTRNKKAHRMYVFENGLAINKVGTNFFNQIKGTTINAYFKNGQVDYMRAKGNAESVYYVQDDARAYTGVNKAHADIIDMIFGDKTDSGRELRKVIMRNDVEGSMIPFKKVNFDDMRLRGFKWWEARRPKSKEELYQ